MTEQLKNKIEYFENILLTRFEKESGINLQAQPNKDLRNAFSAHNYLKSWLADHEKIKSRQDPAWEKVVKCYLLEEPKVFELELANSISSFAPGSEINAMKDHINGLALAIAYEQIRFKLIGNLIATMPNS